MVIRFRRLGDGLPADGSLLGSLRRSGPVFALFGTDSEVGAGGFFPVTDREGRLRELDFGGEEALCNLAVCDLAEGGPGCPADR